MALVNLAGTAPYESVDPLFGLQMPPLSATVKQLNDSPPCWLSEVLLIDVAVEKTGRPINNNFIHMFYLLAHSISQEPSSTATIFH